MNGVADEHRRYVGPVFAHMLEGRSILWIEKPHGLVPDDGCGNAGWWHCNDRMPGVDECMVQPEEFDALGPELGLILRPDKPVMASSRRYSPECVSANCAGFAAVTLISSPVKSMSANAQMPGAESVRQNPKPEAVTFLSLPSWSTHSSSGRPNAPRGSSISCSRTRSATSKR